MPSLPALVAVGTAAMLVGAQPLPLSCAEAARSLLARATASPTDAGVERDYLSAIGACPSDGDLLNNLADYYEQTGRVDEALAYYQRAAAAYRAADAPAPRQALPLFGLGDVYRALGRDSEALYWYRKGLELDDDDALTRDAVRALTRQDPPALVGARSIRAALEGARGPGVVESAVRLDERVLPFAFDSATLLPDARSQLREIAHALYDLLDVTRGPAVLAAGPAVAAIVGHADARGSDAYNLDLARRRAEAVVEALVEEHRVPRTRLVSRSAGAREPLCPEATDACHARNRRVEIQRP